MTQINKVDTVRFVQDKNNKYYIASIKYGVFLKVQLTARGH